MNNYTEVKALPIGYSVSDNFAPGLRSVIARKSSWGVILSAEGYNRYIGWAELDRMVYGV
jgi:hypothetical protein